MTPRLPYRPPRDSALLEVKSIVEVCEAEFRLFRKASDRFHVTIEKRLHALRNVFLKSDRIREMDPRKTAAVLTNYKPLSEREVQILKLIAEGNGTKQAAQALGIAYKTAVGHRSKLMAKLGMHDSVSLTRYAIRTGLIDP